MSIADSDSGLCDAPQLEAAPGAQAHLGSGGLWLNGDVLACACPTCGAPMAIRLWLRTADCWRCGTSIELTEWQEEEARRLLQQRDSQPSPSAAALTADRRLSERAPPEASTVSRLAPDPPTRVVPPPRRPKPDRVAPPPRREPAAVEPKPVEPPPKQPTGEEILPKAWWRCAWIHNLVSWLASMIFHMLLVILLGLWLIRDETVPRPLLLAVQFADKYKEGDAPLFEEPTDTPEFEAPQMADLKNVDELKAPAQREITLPDPSRVFDESLTLDLSQQHVAPTFAGAAQLGKTLSGRDPRFRDQMLAREGGTSQTEAAVARGLMWLARHQNHNGSWSLDAFNLTDGCRGQCSATGVHSDTSATSLALLAFLGAGQTHLEGKYTETVARGLRWLIDSQRDDGDLRGSGSGQMYAHGQAAIALCEAYGMTRHELLQEPAQKSIDFIVAAQHFQGGWRYSPGEPGDTSVVGWQLMALRSAQMAYLDVPADTFAKAMRFLDKAQTDRYQALYSYMPGGRATPAMTAEGLLCRQYGGWKQRHPPLVAGVRWLQENYPPSKSWRGRLDMYYLYYATQVLHHMGGTDWDEWNAQVRPLLLDAQETDGHEAGSWTPNGGHDTRGGRVYMTALAVLTLEVYYRHLPLYQR